MTAEPQDDPARPASSGPEPAVPPVRAVARVAVIPTPTARGRATVLGAINPMLRDAPPFVPPPKPVVAKAAVPVEIEEAEPAEVPDQSEPPAAPNPDVPAKPSRLKRLSRRAVLPVAAALLAAFVGATGYLMIRQPAISDDIGRWTGDQAAAPAASAGTPADEAPFAVAADATANPFGTTGPALTGPPTRLKVKAIGIDTALETLKLDATGALVPPKSFPKAGWYSGGTAPGDTGPAVIAGHVDSKRGPAVFYKLRELTKGDQIEVVRGGQTVRFTVTSTAWYPKTKFPADEVYAPTPDRQLRLITCGGVFDRTLRSYKDNLVVYAVAG